MSMPKRRDWTKVKRSERYLVSKPKLQHWFIWQPTPGRANTYTNADWVGCQENWKSTIGRMIKMGNHTIKNWSKTQTLIALISREFELCVTLRTFAETPGIISMLNDYGVKITREIWGDAQVALGIIHRKKFGNTRHIQTGSLWLQHFFAEQKTS